MLKYYKKNYTIPKQQKLLRIENTNIPNNIKRQKPTTKNSKTQWKYQQTTKHTQIYTTIKTTEQKQSTNKKHPTKNANTLKKQNHSKNTK